MLGRPHAWWPLTCALSLLAWRAEAQQPVPACPPDAVCEDVEVQPPQPAEEAAPEPDAAPEEPPPPEALPSPEPDATAPDVAVSLASEHDDWDAPGQVEDPQPSSATSTAVTNTGVAIFFSGYGVPLIVGAVAAGMADDGHDEALPYIPMLVPVVGPLVTGALIDDTPKPLWALFGASSALQLAGLVTLAVGLTTRDRPAAQARRWQPTADGFRIRF